MKKVEFRKPDKKERGEIYHILVDALSLEKFSDDKDIRIDFAKWMYWKMLGKQACIRVARTRDNIVGLVAAVTTESRNSLPAWMGKNSTALWLQCHFEGRKLLKLYKELEKGRSELKTESQSACGYLSVFWVSPAYKGQVEAQLFQEMETYFSEKNIREVRTVLNNFSNLSFYQKMGFEKKCSQEQMIEPKGQRFRMNQMLYVKEIN